LVDLPPLVPVVDARAAAHLVDCMILVIEWGRTGIDVVRHALEMAPDLHQAIVGAAINKTNMDRLGKYDAQHKSTYKDKYYSKYAYLESSRGLCGEVDQNAVCYSPIEIAGGSLGSRRYSGSDAAELEFSNRNQDSGTSRDNKSYSLSTEECHS
jgi:Mrp family chromosome partitioning ATPase